MKINLRMLVSLLALVSALSATAQGNDPLTAEEKAYFFHIVRKSPILENNLGRYLEYSGPDIRFANKQLNYDSIESCIINDPNLLFIRQSEIAKAPKGLLAEAANKMALWELNKVLLAKRNGPKDLAPYQSKYDLFEAFWIKFLPKDALSYEAGIASPHPKLVTLTNPSLSLDDKKNLVGSFSFLDLEAQLVTLEAVNRAVELYVAKRTEFFFRALGGTAEVLVNKLIAAGDGSSTSGLLEEREKDEKGRWNAGLPKAVGFFPYQLSVQAATKKEKATIQPARFASMDFETVGDNKLTNLHLDVWGYNAKKQTTVVIEKNGLAYPLFGSGETRFLSPDSSFSQGATFQSIINELKATKIDKLNEMIYGKRGFDYWIAYWKEKEHLKKLEIDQTEKELSEMRQSPIYTTKKAKKKKGTKSINTVNGNKHRRAKQELVIDQYKELSAIQKKIQELEKDKQEAIDLLAQYQQKYDIYRRQLGYRWAKYTEEDGLYTFEDSSTFDLLTQEFQFPPSADKTPFEVRLIAIPYGAITSETDEVMLHAHLSDALPDYDAKLQLELQDVFASDAWTFDASLLRATDSVAMRQFFEALKDKKLPLEIRVYGQGVGTWNGAQVIKLDSLVEWTNYPGATADERLASRESQALKRLRTSQLKISLNRKIVVDVRSFTDPVKSNLVVQNPVVTAFMQKYGASKNEILSAYRSAFLLRQFQAEMNVLAGQYLDRETAKIVIDRFNSACAKTRVTIGKHSLKMSDLSQ